MRSQSLAPLVASSETHSERKDYLSHAIANSNKCQRVRSGGSEAARWYVLDDNKSYTSGIIHWKFRIISEAVPSSIIIGVTNPDNIYRFRYFNHNNNDDGTIYYWFYNYGILYSNDEQVKFGRNAKHFGVNDTITMQLKRKYGMKKLETLNFDSVLQTLIE